MQLWQHATYHELTYHAQNLCFFLRLKYILKVVFNAASLAYPEVNMPCLYKATKAYRMWLQKK